MTSSQPLDAGRIARMKQWIDGASYEALLERWRNAPTGSPWFTGEVGMYYGKVLATRKSAHPDEAVRASKSVGWDK